MNEERIAEMLAPGTLLGTIGAVALSLKYGWSVEGVIFLLIAGAMSNWFCNLITRPRD